MKETRNKQRLKEIVSTEESFNSFLEELHALRREGMAEELGWLSPQPAPGMVFRIMRQIRADDECGADPRILGVAAALGFLLLGALLFSMTQLFPPVDGTSIGLFWLVIGLSLCGTIPMLVLDLIRTEHPVSAWVRLRRELK